MADEAATPSPAPESGTAGSTTGFTSGGAGPGTSFEGLDLDQDFDSVTIPAPDGGTPSAGPQVRVEDPTAASVTAPVAAPAATPQPAVAAPVAQPPPQPVQAPQAAPQGAAREPSEIKTPEDFMRAWDEGRNALIERIATEQFALSDEDLVALDQDPQTALPKLLAKVLFTSISAAQKLMIDQVPLIVANHVKATTTQRDASNAFYTKFPHLKDPKHLATVQKFADIYKASFPEMPLEQRIDEIGKLAMNHLNIQVSQPQAANGQRPPARVVSQQHLPAAASAGTRGAPVQPDHNPFAGAEIDWGD